MASIQCGRNVLRQIIKDARVCTSDPVIHPLLFNGQGVRYRKLEVILTTSIEKLGKAGETVKVAPGYFRNHLMPKLLAVPNIDKYAYLIREQRKIYQPEELETVTVAVPKTKEDNMKEYQMAAKLLDNSRLSLRRLVKVDNDLRSPVMIDEIVDEVARQLCVKIQPENLHLPSPFTTLGEYEIPLRLPRAIPLPVGKLHWTLKVKIRRK